MTGERLDLLGDHGEAAACFTGPRRLDGGVEREKIGLLGDRGDQLDHVPDPVCGLRQRIDARVRFVGLLHRALGDAIGFLYLRRNLPYRTCKLFGGRGHRLHVVGSIRRGIGDHVRKPRGVAGIIAERPCGAFQVAGSCHQPGDDGPETLARFGDCVFAGLAVGAEIKRDDIFGIEQVGLGDSVQHCRLFVARGMRGPPETRNLDLGFDGPH